MPFRQLRISLCAPEGKGFKFSSLDTWLLHGCQASGSYARGCDIATMLLLGWNICAFCLTHQAGVVEGPPSCTALQFVSFAWGPQGFLAFQDTCLKASCFLRPVPPQRMCAPNAQTQHAVQSCYDGLTHMTDPTLQGRIVKTRYGDD